MAYLLTRSGRIVQIGLGLALLLALGSPVVRAQTNADVEFSSVSQNDPHPTVYSWKGKNEPVIEPGPYYYAFYYTGTINPDARVPTDMKIERIALPISEWEANKKWILSKLTLYFQLSKNVAPTALTELAGSTQGGGTQRTSGGDNTGGLVGQGQQMLAQGQQVVAGTTGAISEYGNMVDRAGQPGTAQWNGNTPGAPIDSGVAPATTNYYGGGPGSPPGGPGMNMGGMPNNGPGGRGGQGGQGDFDPRAAAEWTFYYDQLVLWQYYCARQLLNGMDTQLLEANPEPVRPTRDTSSRSQMMTTQQILEPDVSTVDIASNLKPGGTSKESLNLLQNRTRMNGGGGSGMGGNGMGGYGMGSPAGGALNYMGGGIGPGGMMGPAGMGGGMMGPPGGMMGGPGGMSGGTGKQPAAVRENFSPMEDFRNPDRNLEYRKTFEEAAKTQEQSLYKTFLDMINRIDQRQVNQDSYEEWRQNKRNELTNFAESWRWAEAGQKGDSADTVTLMMNNNLYLVTKAPLDSVPLNGVNIIKGEQLTPQDLLNADGTLKKSKID